MNPTPLDQFCTELEALLAKYGAELEIETHQYSEVTTETYLYVRIGDDKSQAPTWASSGANEPQGVA
jgi:hypothetical protein